VWPCNVPLPALRPAVTTVAESFVRIFPKLVENPKHRLCAKGMPAVAVAAAAFWIGEFIGSARDLTQQTGPRVSRKTLVSEGCSGEA